MFRRCLRQEAHQSEPADGNDLPRGRPEGSESDSGASGNGRGSKPRWIAAAAPWPPFWFRTARCAWATTSSSATPLAKCAPCLMIAATSLKKRRHRRRLKCLAWKACRIRETVPGRCRPRKANGISQYRNRTSAKPTGQEFPRFAGRPGRAIEDCRHEGSADHHQGRCQRLSRKCWPITAHKLSNEKVRVKIIHTGVGAINENDVLLASASNAIIIGFNVRPERKAQELADRKTSISACTRSFTSCRTRSRKPCWACSIRSSRKTTRAAPKFSTRSAFRRRAPSPAATLLDGLIKRDSDVRLMRDGDAGLQRQGWFAQALQRRCERSAQRHGMRYQSPELQ